MYIFEFRAEGMDDKEVRYFTSIGEREEYIQFFKERIGSQGDIYYWE